MDFVLRFIDVLFNLLTMAIIGRVLISWFNVSPSSRIYRFLRDTTEPIMAPIRRAMPRTGMIDFSPIVALLALDIIRALLIRILIGL